MRATNPASNPELLDALAEEFRRVGYDQKKLLKTIMSSHVYALSSIPNETNAADIRNFSRHYRKRMRAEVLADAIVDITGVPIAYDGAAPARGRCSYGPSAPAAICWTPSAVPIRTRIRPANARRCDHGASLALDER